MTIENLHWTSTTEQKPLFTFQWNPSRLGAMPMSYRPPNATAGSGHLSLLRQPTYYSRIIEQQIRMLHASFLWLLPTHCVIAHSEPFHIRRTAIHQELLLCIVKKSMRCIRSFQSFFSALLRKDDTHWVKEIRDLLASFSSRILMNNWLPKTHRRQKFSCHQTRSDQLRPRTNWRTKLQIFHDCAEDTT